MKRSEIISNLKMLKLFPIDNLKTSSLPRASGVYIYFDSKKNILYIGKSKNLRLRISSYFHSKLYGKTKTLISKSKYLSFITVNSEIESLLLEAKLINKVKPPYNLELKDDKKPLYIRITKEVYPRVLTARKVDSNKGNIALFGPFPSSGNVKSVLKVIRKIFPYSTHKLDKKACIHSQMGLCDPCPNVIESKNNEEKYKMKNIYFKNIKYIKKFLNGDFSYIKTNLKDEIDFYSKKELFEKAKEIKEQLEQIEYITQPIINAFEYIKNPNLLEDVIFNETNDLINLLKPFFPDIGKLKRIECYDVAHLQGSFPTASMVTFINGVPEKSLYRKFKILQENKESDTDSLQEVAIRRKKHIVDWEKPDLMVIDGGKGQVSSFVKIFKKQIPIVGIAKKYETLVIPYFSKNRLKYNQKKLCNGSLFLIQKLRDEAHRFSRSYHHKLIEVQLFSKNN